MLDVCEFELVRELEVDVEDLLEVCEFELVRELEEVVDEALVMRQEQAELTALGSEEQFSR